LAGEGLPAVAVASTSGADSKGDARRGLHAEQEPEPAPEVEPKPAVLTPEPEPKPTQGSKPEATQPWKTSSRKTTAAASDSVIRRTLESKITARCSQALDGTPLRISLVVLPSGAITGLVAKPMNAAGRCAVDLVRGTEFRPRASPEPMILNVE
jgi:hypothetical protein